MNWKLNIKTAFILSLVTGFGLIPFSGLAGEGVSRPGVEEAREIFKIEKEYFDNRIHSKWDAIYERQHPELKKKVTLELFVNRAGLVGDDTVEDIKASRPGGISIMPQPSNVITTPRDALGFPTTRRYRIIPNPWVRINKHHYDRVWISPDGRYARVDVKLDVIERLPPHLFKVDMVLPHTRDHFDYWEKVGGKWVVALMVHRVSFSGGKIPVTFIPKKIEELDKIDWIGFDPKTLETPKASHE